MKTVLITGADGALGKHVMNRFASVSKAIGTRLPPSAGAEPELRENWLSVDLSSGRAMARAWELLGSAKSEPDIVVHCAGGFRYSPQEAISDADLEFLLSANLKSSLLLSRAAIPAMKAKSYGRLIFVGARGALGAAPNMAAYAATKAGVHSLVLSLAEELKGTGITVNAVLPSVIDTPANRRDMAGADFSKWVTPEALAELIFTLTQEVAAPVSGALLPVPGGM